MRQYRDQAELMAVFTRLSTKSALTLQDFSFVQDDAAVLCQLLTNAVARKEAGINILLYGPPGTGKTELAKVVAQSAGLELFEVEYADRDGNSLSGRERYRSLQIAQVFLKGSAQAALLFDEVEDVFPPLSSETAHLLARADASAAPASHSVNGKAWVNQISGNQRRAHAVGHQPDRTNRPRVSPPLCLPSGAQVAAAGRTRILGAQNLGQFTGIRCTRRSAQWPQRAYPGPNQNRCALCQPGNRGASPRQGPALEALIERQLRNADAALGNAAASRAVTYRPAQLRPGLAERGMPLRNSPSWWRR